MFTLPSSDSLQTIVYSHGQPGAPAVWPDCGHPIGDRGGEAWPRLGPPPDPDPGHADGGHVIAVWGWGRGHGGRGREVSVKGLFGGYIGRGPEAVGAGCGGGHDRPPGPGLGAASWGEVGEDRVDVVTALTSVIGHHSRPRWRLALTSWLVNVALNVLFGLGDVLPKWLSPAVIIKSPVRRLGLWPPDLELVSVSRLFPPATLSRRNVDLIVGANGQSVFVCGSGRVTRRRRENRGLVLNIGHWSNGPSPLHFSLGPRPPSSHRRAGGLRRFLGLLGRRKTENLASAGVKQDLERPGLRSSKSGFRRRPSLPRRRIRVKGRKSIKDCCGCCWLILL